MKGVGKRLVVELFLADLPVVKGGRDANRPLGNLGFIVCQGRIERQKGIGVIDIINRMLTERGAGSTALVELGGLDSPVAHAVNTLIPERIGYSYSDGVVASRVRKVPSEILPVDIYRAAGHIAVRGVGIKQRGPSIGEVPTGREVDSGDATIGVILKLIGPAVGQDDGCYDFARATILANAAGKARGRERVEVCLQIHGRVVGCIGLEHAIRVVDVVENLICAVLLADDGAAQRIDSADSLASLVSV